jgi:hypothetical protein
MTAVAAEASPVQPAPAEAPGPPRPDPLLQGLLRLTRQLERPCAEAELKAAAAIPEAGADAACLARLAERLGFAPRLERATKARLGRTPRRSCCSVRGRTRRGRAGRGSCGPAPAGT